MSALNRSKNVSKRHDSNQSRRSRRIPKTEIAPSIRATALGELLEPRVMLKAELASDQWHLDQINFPNVDPAIRGDNVVVGVLDTGIQFDHPDLKGAAWNNPNPDQVNASKANQHGFDFFAVSPDAQAQFPNQLTPAWGIHGTNVAGIIAAQPNQSDLIGVASGAQLASLRIGIENNVGFNANSALSYELNEIDIFNNSWNLPQLVESPGTREAVKLGISTGRTDPQTGEALGNIYVWNAGNFAESDERSNFSFGANLRYAITVGSTDDAGNPSVFSEPGDNVLISAPGGIWIDPNDNNIWHGVVTTDPLGNDGINDAVPKPDCAETTELDYTRCFIGTSASAPIVSGVVALMLEANPGLTWRDVQHILVRTANSEAIADFESKRNIAGLPFDEQMGFGIVDAAKAVETAKSWINVDPEISVSIPNTTQVDLPDDGSNIELDFHPVDDMLVESVEIRIEVDHPTELMDGRVSALLIHEYEDSQTDVTTSISDLALTGVPLNTQDGLSWSFTSKRHWGEPSGGTWKLVMWDAASGDNLVDQVTHRTLTLHGTRRAPSATLFGNVVVQGVTAIAGNPNEAELRALADGILQQHDGWIATVDATSGTIDIPRSVLPTLPGRDWSGDDVVACHVGDACAVVYENQSDGDLDAALEMDLGDLSPFDSATLELSFFYDPQDLDDSSERLTVDLFHDGQWETIWLSQFADDGDQVTQPEDWIASGNLTLSELANVNDWTDIRIRFTSPASLDAESESGDQDEILLDTITVTGERLDAPGETELLFSESFEDGTFRRWNYVDDRWRITQGGTTTSMGELVVLVRWQEDGDKSISAQNARDAVYSVLTEIGVIEPDESSSDAPLHLIGHGVGSILISQVVEQLALDNIAVDHLTYLDPIEGSDNGKTPARGTIAVWDNVDFADVYYQTRDRSFAPAATAARSGRPIPGAYNVQLTESDYLPTEEYAANNIQGDHRYVWEGFYLSTINEQSPADNELLLGTKDTPSAVSNDYATLGHAFSRAQQQADRPLSNYFADGLDHSTSPASLVDQSGDPNHAELLSMRLTAQDIVSARWSPHADRNQIANGRFDTILVDDNMATAPGWSAIDKRPLSIQSLTNGQLVLSGLLPAVEHQTVWLPATTTELLLDLQVLSPASDTFEVRLGDQVLTSVGAAPNLEQQSLDMETFRFLIPSELANRGHVLSLQIRSNNDQVESTVSIDNVRLNTNQHQAKSGDVTTIDLFAPTGDPLLFSMLSELESDAGRVVLDDDFANNGRIYFVPDIEPAGPRVVPDDDNGVENDDDTMELEFSVDQGNGPESIVARIQIVDGYSTHGPNSVTLSGAVDSFAASDPLDVMQVQQRLRYLNFRGEDNTPVAVDGDAGPITREAIKLFQAATVSDGLGDPKSSNVFIDGVVDPDLRSNRWLNSPQAPFWSELRLPLQNPVDIGNETWATSWALEIIERAVQLRPALLRVGPEETLGANALTEYPDASHASPNNKAGMTIVWELEQDQLLDADEGDDLTVAEQNVIDDVLAFHQAAGHQLTKVRVGANANQYQRIRAELTAAGVPNVVPGANGAFAVHLVPPQADHEMELAVQDALLETLETLRDEVVFSLLSQPNAQVELPLINRSLADSIDVAGAIDQAIRLPLADYLAVHSAPRLHDLNRVLLESQKQFDALRIDLGELSLDIDRTVEPNQLRMAMQLDITQRQFVDRGGDLPLNQATGPQSVLDPRSLLPSYDVRFQMPFELSIPIQEDPIPDEAITLRPGSANIEVRGENLTDFNARVGVLDVSVDGDPVVLHGQVRLDWTQLQANNQLSLQEAKNPFLNEKLATQVVAQTLDGYLPIQAGLCATPGDGAEVSLSLDDLFSGIDVNSAITTNAAFDALRIYENLSPMHLFGMLDQAARVLSSIGVGFDMPEEYGMVPSNTPVDQLRQSLPLLGSPVSSILDAGAPLQAMVDGLLNGEDLTFQTLDGLLREIARLGGSSLQHVGVRCDAESETVLLDLRLTDRVDTEVMLDLRGQLGPVEAPMGANAGLVGDVQLDLTLGFDFAPVSLTENDFLATPLSALNGGFGVRTHDGPDIEVMRPDVDLIISTAGNDTIFDSLNDGNIPVDVLQAFSDAGHALSGSAVVFDDGRFGDTWRIVDGSQAYDMTYMLGDSEIVVLGTIFLIDLDDLGNDATMEDALNLITTQTNDGVNQVEWQTVVNPDTGFVVGVTLTDTAHPTGSPRPFAISGGKRFETVDGIVEASTSRAAGDLGIGGVDLELDGTIDGLLATDGLADRFFFGENSRLTLDGNLFASNIEMETAIHGVGTAIESGRVELDFRSVVELQDPGESTQDDGRLTLREILLNPLEDVVVVTANEIEGSGRLPIVGGNESLNITLGIDGEHPQTDALDGPELNLVVSGTDVQAVLSESLTQQLDGFQHFNADVACAAIGQLVEQFASHQMPLLNAELPIIGQSLAELLGFDEFFSNGTATACPDLGTLQDELEALLPTLDSNVEPIGAIPAIYPELSSSDRNRISELRDSLSSALGQDSLNEFANQLAGALNGLQGFAESLSPSPGRNQLLSFTSQATNLLPSFDSLESGIIDAFELENDQLTLEFIDLDPSPDTLERAAIFELTKVFTEMPNVPLDFGIDLGAVPISFDAGGEVMLDLGATFNLKFGVNLSDAVNDNERLFLIADDGNGDGTFIDLTLGLDAALSPSLTLGGVEAVTVDQGQVAFKERLTVEPQLNNGTYENFNLPPGTEAIAFVEVDDTLRPSTDYTLTANSLIFDNNSPPENAVVRIHYPGNDDASIVFRTTDPNPDPQRIVPLSDFADQLADTIEVEPAGMAAISLTGLTIGGLLEPFAEDDGVRAFADLSDLENRFFQYPNEVADTLENLELPGEDSCNLPLMIDAFATLLDTIEAGLTSDILSRLPIIGDRLDFEGTAFEQIRGVLDETVNHFGSTDQFRTFLATTLGNAEGAGAQLNLLLTDALSQVTDVSQIGDGPNSGMVNWAMIPESGPVCGEFHVRLGGVMEIGTDFDLGLDALVLDVETVGGVTLMLDYTIDVGFGISKSEGAYLLLNEDGAAPEIQLGLDVHLEDDTELTLDLFFLRLAASEREEPQDEAPRATGLSGEITIDIDAPAKLPLADLTAQPFTERFDFAMALDAVVDLTLNAGIANPNVPSLSADLLVDWGFDVDFGEDEPFRGDELDVRFENFGIDLGEFVTDAIRPVVEKIDEVLQPIDPLIEFLQFEIPLISQVAQLLGQDPVTILSLVGLIGDGAEKAVQAIEIIVTIREIAASLANSDGTYRIEFGDFDLPDDPNTFDLRDAETVIDTLQVSAENPQAFSGGEDFGNKIEGDRDPNANEGGGFFANILSTLADIGVDFPLLSNPASAFNILFGQPVDLVTYDLLGSGPEDRLQATFGWTQSFGPLIPPVPLFANVFAEFTLFTDFKIGFDTYGFQTGTFVDGFYFADEDPVLGMRAEFGAAAELSLGLFWGGVRGGVGAEIGAGWNDVNDDGKFRTTELVDRVKQGLVCVFELEGSMDAFLELYAGAGIDFFGKKITLFETMIELLRLTIFEFSVGCPPLPPPNLGHVTNNDHLVINVGPHADKRQTGAEDGEDLVEISYEMFKNPGEQQESLQYVVSAFGESQGFTNIDRIVVHTGDQNDQVIVSDTVTIPVEVDGGAGDDIIVVPAGDSNELFGGEGNDRITGGNNGNTIMGGPGDDILVGGDLVDIIDGGEGNDQIRGGDGDDQLFGQAGDDEIDGGLGADTIDGGDGNDSLAGGDFNPDNESVDGPNTITGGDGDDLLQGGDVDDTLDAGPGNDILHGYTGNDTLIAGPGDDLLRAGEGDDYLEGGDGNDQLQGGSGNDLYFFATVMGSVEEDVIEDADNIFDEQGVNLEIDTLDFSGLAAGDGVNVNLSGSGRAQHERRRIQIRNPIRIENVIGGDGDDLIADNANNNRFEGGLGNDTYFFGASAGTTNDLHIDTVIETDFELGGSDTLDFSDLPNTDMLTADLSNDPLLADPLVAQHTTRTVVTGANDMRQHFENVTGGAADDTIYGNAARNRLIGNAGDDLIFGFDNDDEIRGNDGVDSLEGGNGEDVIYGGADDDRIRGQAQDDTIFGGSGNDDIEGNDGADTIHGDAGIDEIQGGTGDDEIYGGGDSDVIFGDEGNDQIAGNNGDDTIFGGPGNDYIMGDAGEDRLFGQSGDDTLEGGPNRDYLLGDLGNDRVSGGSGDDFLSGGQDSGQRLTAPDSFTLDETEFGDLMFGDPGHDLVTGGLPADGQGDDQTNLERLSAPLFLDMFDDVEFFPPNPFGFVNYIRAGQFSYTLVTGVERVETINSGGDDNDDLLHGGSGNDLLIGDDGADNLYGDWGNDVMFGYRVGDVSALDEDRLEGGPDNDDPMCGTAGANFFVGGTSPHNLDYILNDPGAPIASPTSGGYVFESCFDEFPELLDYLPVEIHGQKFEDVNGDGLKGDDELGLDGWTIELRDETGTLLATAITESRDTNDDGAIDPLTESGLYSFFDVEAGGNVEGMQAGIYQVNEVQQVGFAQTLPAPDGILPPSIEADVVPVELTPGSTTQTYVLALNSGELPEDVDIAQQVDFGNAHLGRVRGNLFHDLDTDRSLDPEEGGLEGWKITLAQPIGQGEFTIVGTIESDAEGNFEFDQLFPGTYVFGHPEPPESGWLRTAPESFPFETFEVQYGQLVADKNFGYTATGTLSGEAWIDENADGTRQDDEQQLHSSGLVSLDIDQDGQRETFVNIGAASLSTVDIEFDEFGTVEVEIESDGNGAYAFRGLPRGIYTVWHTSTLFTSAPTDNEGRHRVELDPGEAVDDLDFGKFQFASVSGVVWHDVNNDGIVDNGETLLEGRTVFLDSNDNGMIDEGERSDDTNEILNVGAGEFGITFLRPGEYNVVLEPFEDWRTTVPLEDESGFQGYRLTLTSGEAAEVNFAQRQANSISGLKWHDLNADGIRDANEPGLPNWTIFLDGSGEGSANGELDRDEFGVPLELVFVTRFDDPDTEADESGTFEFKNLPDGVYSVREVLQEGWQATYPNDPHEVAVEQDAIQSIEFGNVKLAEIRGTKWNDVNGDGDRDTTDHLSGPLSGDVGLANWRVYLDLNQNGVLDDGEPTQLTLDDDPETPIDETGNYAFVVTPGTYHVREVPEAGWIASVPRGEMAYLQVVEVQSGEQIEGVDFANTEAAEITGTKFVDLNLNGQRDESEPALADVVVYLDLNVNGELDFEEGQPIEPVSITDADGAFQFINLLPGFYSVAERAVLGYQQTQPNLLEAYRYVVHLEQGEARTDLLFGNGQFGDCNRDGTVDLQDALAFAAAFHSSVGAAPFEPERYDVCFDFDLDDDIDFEDAYAFRTVWDNPGPLPAEPPVPSENKDDKSPDDDPSEHGTGNESPTTGTPRAEDDRSRVIAISKQASLRYLVPSDFVSGWQGLEFDDGRWSRGQMPMGFASPPNPIDTIINTDVARSMLGVNSTVYVRVPFELTDVTRVDTATLSLRYDDGFVAWVNGREVGSRNAPGRLIWNSSASEAREGDDVLTPEAISIEPSLLRQGENILAIQVLNASPRDADLLIDLELILSIENQDPIGAGECFAVAPGTTIVGSGLLNNDFDPDGDLIAAELVVAPEFGELTLFADGSFNYLPGADFPGSDQFTYVAVDKFGGRSEPILVTLGDCPSSIYGTKWHDLNQDGQRTENEPPLAGWMIFADLDGNQTFDEGEPSDVTDENGNYHLELTSGTYQIFEVQQEGWTQTFPTLAGTPLPGWHTVNLESNTVIEGLNFGNVGLGEIHGTKWHDRNANGEREADEPGLPGWTIYLDLNNSGRLDEGEPSTVTDEAGNYWFTDLVPATYRVAEVLQTGWVQTFPSSTAAGSPFSHTLRVQSGTVFEGVDFGNFARGGEIHGSKFEDVNGNGVRDPGANEPGLRLWTIYLDLNDNGRLDEGEPVTQTDREGNYWFVGLDEGDYNVREVVGEGYFQTAPLASFAGPYPFVAPEAGVIASASGDFTGDALPDLVFADHDGRLQLATNLGKDYSVTLIDAAVQEVRELVILDLNDDGQNDVVLQTGGRLYYYENQGGGAFATSVALAALMPPNTEIVAGDVNGDGRLDVVFGEQQAIRLTTNQGDGTLVSTSVDVGAPIADVTVTDVNNDGLMDVIAILEDSSTFTVLLATGDAADPLLLTASGDAGLVNPAHVIAADLNQDGNQDFVFIPSDATALSWVPNGGSTVDLRFDAPEALPVTGPIGEIIVRDLNNDGLPDFAIVPPGSNHINILIRDTKGGYVDGGTLVASQPITELDVTDFDGDGQPDLVAGHARGFSVFRRGILDGFSVHLEPGQVVEGLAFGNFRGGRISGTKFWDVPCGGPLEPEFAAEESVTVYVDLNNNGEFDLFEPNATTDENGNYSIFPVPRGTYPVREILPEGYAQRLPDGEVHMVTIDFSSQTVDGIDFTNFRHIPLPDGDDWIYGFDASDTLYGDNLVDDPCILSIGGDDHLFGQGGDDLLIGQLRNDTYHFDPAPEDGSEESDGILELVGRGTNQRTDEGIHDRLDFSVLGGDEPVIIDVSSNPPQDFAVTEVARHENALGGVHRVFVVQEELRSNLEDLVGGQADDLLIANEFNNLLDGQAGSDLLQGQAGDDTYVFVLGNEDDHDQLIETIGNDTLDFGQLDTSVTVDLSFPSLLTAAPIVAQFGLPLRTVTSMTPGLFENVIGSTVADVIRGGDEANIIQGTDGDDELQIVGGNDLVGGGAGDDHYRFEKEWGIDLIFEAEDQGSNDVLDFSQVDVPLTWTVGQIIRVTDGINLAAHLGLNLEELIGGSSTNTLVGGDFDNQWIIDGVNSGTLNGIRFQGMTNLVGGTGNDSFVILPGGRIDGDLDGGAGNDVFDLSMADANAVSGTLIGGDDEDHLRGRDTDSTWTLDALGGGTLTDVGSFTGFEELEGGASNDAYVVNGGSLTGLIHGGEGEDQLTYQGNAPITFLINQDHAGLATNLGGFASIESLLGGDGDDRYLVVDGRLNGRIDGQLGSDTLEYTDLPMVIELSAANGGTANRIEDGFASIENLVGGIRPDVIRMSGGSLDGSIDGGGARDTIYLDDTTPHTVEITGDNQGTIDGSLPFVDVENVVGGAMNDTFLINGGRLSGLADGGDGENEIAVTSNVPSLFALLSNGTGVVLESDVTPFTRFDQLTGSDQDDLFLFVGNGAVNAIDGGAGNDQLLGPNVASHWQLSGPQTGSADFVSNFVAIETLVGGTERDTLTAASVVNQWTIDGDGSGQIAGQIAFTGFEELQGGSDVDTVDVLDNIIFDGSLMTGAGNDSINLAPNAFVVELIDGGEDTDQYTLSAAAGATTIQTLTDSGNVGDDQLTVVGTSAAEGWVIAPTFVEVNAQRIEFLNTIESLVVEAGDGADLFLVSPSESMAVHIQGGLPEPPSLLNDTMIVDAMNLESNETEGSVAIGGLVPITHEGVELVLIANSQAQPAHPSELSQLRDRLLHPSRRDMMAMDVDDVWQADADPLAGLEADDLETEIPQQNNDDKHFATDDWLEEFAFRGRRRSRF